MLPILVKIKPNEQTLLLEFANGVQGNVVFTPAFFRGPFHNALRDENMFSQVQKDNLDMLMWPNGFGISLFEVYGCLFTTGTAYIS